MRDLVVLVPGVGLSGIDLLAVAWRLRRRGFRTHIFFCVTWALTLTESARRLQHWLAAQPDPLMHLVGHSFGGLVVLRCLAECGWNRPGRVVTMGTPHTDIAVARQVRRLPFGTWAAGPGVDTALPLLPLPVPADREVGTLAGDRSWGLSFIFPVPSPNDGVICVAETRHPAIAHHLVLPLSHTDLLVSPQAADEVAAFLRRGRFSESQPL